jgi:hypothetical protein
MLLLLLLFGIGCCNCSDAHPSRWRQRRLPHLNIRALLQISVLLPKKAMISHWITTMKEYFLVWCSDERLVGGSSFEEKGHVEMTFTPTTFLKHFGLSKFN